MMVDAIGQAFFLNCGMKKRAPCVVEAYQRNNRDVPNPCLFSLEVDKFIYSYPQAKNFS